MSGSSGGGSSTTVNSNLPPFLEGPYTALVERAQNESLNGYTPYTGPRIAGFTADQRAALNEAGAVGRAGQPYMNAAGGYLGQAGRTAGNFASGANNIRPGTVQAGSVGVGNINPQSIQAGNVNVGNIAAQSIQAGKTSVSDFNSDVAAKYMSPYQQAVTDIGKRQAIMDNDVARMSRNADAVKAGAFGGSRAAAIREAEADANLATRLSDLQVRGLQDSYMNAQQQFERDRTADMMTQQFNTNTKLAADQYNADSRYNANVANVANQFAKDTYNNDRNFEADRYNADSRYNANLANVANRFARDQYNTNLAYDASRSNVANNLTADQFNSQQMLAGGQMAAGLGNQYAALGGQQQEMVGRGLDALLKGGSLRQDQQQRGLDMAYSDFVNQRDYDRQQITWLNNIMRGMPVNPVSEVTTTNPGPSAIGQIAGTGLAALGAYARAQ